MSGIILRCLFSMAVITVVGATALGIVLVAMVLLQPLIGTLGVVLLVLTALALTIYYVTRSKQK